MIKNPYDPASLFNFHNTTKEAFWDGCRNTIQYLEGPCINHPFFVKGKTRYHLKRFCPDCWQELKAGVKDGIST